MAKVHGLIRLLDDEEMQRVHRGALRLLQHTGLRVDHDGILKTLAERGCVVDTGRKLVRFPEEIVDESVARLRRYGSNPAGFPPTHEPRSKQDFGARTGGFVTTVRGLDGERRPADLETARQAFRLADALPHISHVGVPASAQELTAEVRTVRMAAELVKMSAKPGTVEAWSRREVEWLWEIAVVARGSEAEARRRPLLVGYVGLRTPLCLDHAMAEVLAEYSHRGIPYMLYSMPCWASTAPATTAGALLLGVAEVLAGVTIGQAIDDAAKPLPFIAPGALDMRSMLIDVASPLRLNLSVAATQMISLFYGLPCAANCGKAAASDTGVQAGYEKTFSILYPVLAGATSVGPIGQVENGFVFSFRQLVLDHEIVAFAKRLLAGMEVDDDTLAVATIEDVGPGGDFLTVPHTVEHFRRELWSTDIGEHMSHGTEQGKAHLRAEENALEQARRILATHDPHPLTEYQEAEIHRIVAAAAREAQHAEPHTGR